MNVQNRAPVRLDTRLHAIQRRLATRSRWRSWSIAAFVIAVFSFLIYRNTQGVTNRLLEQIDPTPLAISLAGVFAVLMLVGWVRSRRHYRDRPRLAKRIESKFPSLNQSLVTAVDVFDQQQASTKGEISFLQQRVIDEANHHATSASWKRVVPTFSLALTGLVTILAMTSMGVALARVATMPKIDPPITIENETKVVMGLVVEPGDTSIERGTGLVVTATFGGDIIEQTPDQATLVVTSDDGTRTTYSMQRNLNDSTLGAFVSTVGKPMQYEIEFDASKAGGLTRSESYRVDVFDYPALLKSDATLTYPEYTSQTEKTVQDTRRVAAVEGTDLSWKLFLNKPVRSATLVGNDGDEIELPVDFSDAEVSVPSSVATYDTTIEKTRRYRLRLVDADGRENKLPPEFVVRSLPNQPPKLEIAQPRDMRVSPLEEWTMNAKVGDDFGLQRAGVSIRFSNEETDILLVSNSTRRGTSQLSHDVLMEDLGAKPDDLLAYYFWAEDTGPDGKPRRVEGDLFLAEVRPFEEIYREGQPQEGGQPGQPSPSGQQAEELADLQKQIIDATWTLIRQTSSGTKSEFPLTDDIDVIAESQRSAIEQVTELKSKLRDRDSQGYADEAIAAMNEAVAGLEAARAMAEFADKRSLETTQVSKLMRTALNFEQAAYQKMLSLRGREYEISRSNQQQQSKGSGSAGQKQKRLQQLELENEEQRYETQNQANAATPDEQAQRETRQILNRLRDLAKRQQDLNDQLAQLQSAIQLAETPEQKDELERQLKRLREQQQELLRETDEVGQRMESSRADRQQQSDSSSQEQTSSQETAEEQLENTRENVRQAAEALAEGNVSQALSAGKRAESELEELRDDFRKQAAGEFGEAMQDLKKQAQELVQQQRELTQQSADKADAAEPGLRTDAPEESLSERIAEQRDDLRRLLEDAERTVQEAETAEPLLAQKLYDSYRRAKQSQIDKQLETVDELTKRGFDQEAQPFNDKALEAVEQLKEDVDEAATAVLGDPTEGLKRAASELERLSDQLDREQAARNPGQQAASGQPSDQAEQQPREDSARSQSPSEDSPDAQPREGQSNEGQSNEGPSNEGQPTEGQPSEGQPGEGKGEPSSEQANGSPSSSDSPPSQSEGGQPGNGSPGSQPGQGGQNRQRPSLRGEPSDSQNNSANGSGGGQTIHGGEPTAGEAGSGPYNGGSPNDGPLSGDGYREWSDAMRDVEEMVESPELRAQASQIRERVREMRRDLKRQSKEPQWNLVEEMIAKPLRELRRDVKEEYMRRSAEKNSNIPIDRDPVPMAFEGAVQEYYEKLGSGRP